MCFSAVWFVHLLIWLIVLGAVIAILKILVPWLLGGLGFAIDGRLMRILYIIIAAVVAIWVVWLIYDLIICAGFYGGPVVR